MSADAWVTAATLVVMLGALAWDRIAPAAVVLAATFALLLLDVIGSDQAFSGFANPAPITVAALYVVARAAQRTALLSALTTRLLGARGGRSSLARLLVPTASASTVFNNTPLVAMLIPDVQAWCRARGLPASRYLLPLSYATILGGVVTVLGTSTNLVVSGLLQARTGEPLGIFEIAPVGGPVALVGMAVLLVAAPVLVPDRLSATEQAEVESREFVIDVEVVPGGPLDGRTVAEAGLRDLEGVFLVSIDRGGQLVSPVAPDRRVDGGDVLTFVGKVDQVVDLQRMRGLRSTEEKHLIAIDSPRQSYFEAVVGRSSPLVGKTVREAEFRGRYQAAVVAVHRAGQRIDAKLGDVRLRHGDTLLLVAGPDFRRNWGDRNDFLLVARLGGEPSHATRKAPLVGLVTAAIVLLAALEVLPIVEGALLGAGVLVAARVLTFSEALDAVDLDVILLIGAAFGLGAAMESSGLAQEIADGLIGLFDGFGSAGIVFGAVLATAVLTELVTNNAAAVVMFPIALAVAEPAGIDPRTMAIGIAVAASASFVTPIGYQTNTMVYGPGGYRFADYVRVGMPVSLGVMATITLTVLAAG
ncbi:MAG TPA: SLC13 family permease [Acidimicrobiales bacterium]|nr:SLC13 family permease [Acidimicrobiales bacterium]